MKNLLRFYRRIRNTLKAELTFPVYVKIENTGITFSARNWSAWGIIKSGELINNHLYYERIETDAIKKMMVGKKVFYDVGASMGYYSYIAKAMGIPCVVAFEPMKVPAEIIKEASDRQHLGILVVNKPVGGGVPWIR